MPAYTDAMGRRLEIERPPSRIVSLVPSLTEALFAFGLGDRVSGVTRFCVEPREGVSGKRKVGGTKNVDIAAVRALEPDLVLANVEENTREDVKALEAAGLPVFLTYPRTVAGAIEELRLLAQMTGANKAARAIVRDAETELRRAEAANKRRTPLRTFCPIWRNPWMTIGPDTYIHDVLRVCGATNVYGTSRERYPKVKLDGPVGQGPSPDPPAASLAPEVVLLPDEPYRFGEKHIPEVIAALGDVRIYPVDGKCLCWYGPRIADSLRTVQRLLWGEDSM